MSQPVHVSTEANIRDPDLLAELEGTRGTPEFADMVRYLAAKQRHRDAGQGTPAPAATIDDPYIRDADLRERLAKVPGDQFGRMMREGLLREQKARDEKSAQLASLTPLARRREAVREELSEPFNSKDRYHVHSVLALCGLPYKKPPEGQGDYVRNTAAAPLWCRPDT